MDIRYFVYPHICWWASRLFSKCLPTVTNAAMNAYVDVFFWVFGFNSFGYIPRSETAGSYDNSVFSVWSKQWIAFHCSCTILPSQQLWTRIPGSPRPHQPWSSCFLITAILLNEKWHCIVVLIWIYPMTNVVEQFFICLWASGIISFEKWLFKSFGHLNN